MIIPTFSMLLFLMVMVVWFGCSLWIIGKETATFASNHLHNNLIDALSSNKLDSTEQCLEYAYIYTDMESSKEDMKNSGSTGVTVLIVNENGKRVVYSANAGDSRSILYSDKETIRLSFVFIPLLSDS